jgi:SAM-dependent methyltransferase
MFDESAEFYDQIYSQFKDYQAEATAIHHLIANKAPATKTILDVACGTGEHARILSQEHGYEVDGVDLDESMVDLAQKKNPTGSFYCADMTDFDIDRSYDAVICLFSSIGYVKTLERVTRTLLMFKKHIHDKGIILIEPWFQPHAFIPGRTILNTGSLDGWKIARMATSQVNGRISTLIFEYLIGHEGEIVHRSETHELGLFTAQEMSTCFTDAGLKADYDESGLTGRGLYCARPHRF